MSLTDILLTADDPTVCERLERRERGIALDIHLERNASAAVHLDVLAGDWVHRIPTSGRSVCEIATEIVGFTGWTDTGVSATGQ